MEVLINAAKPFPLDVSLLESILILLSMEIKREIQNQRFGGLKG